MRRTALSLVVVLLAVGCGTAATIDDPGAAVAAAVERTEAAGSALLSMTVTMEVPDVASPMTVTVNGEIDFASGSSRAWVESVETDAGMPDGYEEMEWVVHGDYLYMRAAMPARPGVDGQPEWMQFPLDPDEDEFGGLGGFGGRSFAGGLGSDPAELLDQLREAVDEVTLVGIEEVRGEVTTRYRASYRLGDVGGGWLDDELDGMPPSAREEYEEFLEVWRDTPVVTDVWVDRDELVRRIRTEVELTDALAAFGEETAGSASSTVEVELFDFGVAVAIEPPDEDLVADLSEMMAQERSASAQVEVPVPDEVAPSPGEAPTATAVRALPEGFPDNFPVYRGYRSVAAQSARDETRYDVRLDYEAHDHPDHDDLFAELVGFHDDALPALGWTVADTDRHDDTGVPTAEYRVEGHGWHGQVTVTQHDPSEVEVHIHLER